MDFQELKRKHIVKYVNKIVVHCSFNTNTKTLAVFSLAFGPSKLEFSPHKKLYMHALQIFFTIELIVSFIRVEVESIIPSMVFLPVLYSNNIHKFYD